MPPPPFKLNGRSLSWHRFHSVQTDFEYTNTWRAKLDMPKASLGQSFMYTRGISWVILKFDTPSQNFFLVFKRITTDYFFQFLTLFYMVNILSQIISPFKNGIIRLDAGAFKFLRNRLSMTSMQLPWKKRRSVKRNLENVALVTVTSRKQHVVFGKVIICPCYCVVFP
jgi:hypothetical protein